MRCLKSIFLVLCMHYDESTVNAAEKLDTVQTSAVHFRWAGHRRHHHHYHHYHHHHQFIIMIYLLKCGWFEMNMKTSYHVMLRYVTPVWAVSFTLPWSHAAPGHATDLVRSALSVCWRFSMWLVSRANLELRLPHLVFIYLKPYLNPLSRAVWTPCGDRGRS